MGDFYEMFFRIPGSPRASASCSQARKYLGKDVPLCGVPVVRADEYLHRRSRLVKCRGVESSEGSAERKRI
jgi:DNA mismatch repair protein MutS